MSSMKVFKFGGASVKSALAVQNVAEILNRYREDKILIVISAMAKTTNALEKLLQAYLNNSSDKMQIFEEVKTFHFQILTELISTNNLLAIPDLQNHFDALKTKLDSKSDGSEAKEYAQIVSYGEVFSTVIVYHYLKENNFNCAWKQAGDYIITDNNYKEANVDWVKSPERIQSQLLPVFEEFDLVITQGFIAKTEQGTVSTLGREGSDYSAAIFAYGLNAEDLTIWKDVPGLLNADPKYFENTQKIDCISYRETIELAYYGASIIHPKTIQPLQNKDIPLYIKSFVDPSAEGSKIQSGTYADLLIPSYIFKKKQVLISISARDFSFIAEQHLSYIFNKMTDYGLKVNLMQNSAISFSLCMDNKGKTMLAFIDELQKDFKVKYNEHMELITIRHYNQEIINDLIGDRKVYLEQKNRTTVQLLVR